MLQWRDYIYSPESWMDYYVANRPTLAFIESIFSLCAAYMEYEHPLLAVYRKEYDGWREIRPSIRAF